MSHYPGMAFGELYDLTADPGELSNVWSQPKYEAMRRRLRDELLDRVMQAHDPLPIRETMY